MTHTPVTPPQARRPGVIRPDEIYTTKELKSRLNWGAHALNKARAGGLPCKRIGNVRFVSGADFAEWLQQQPYENGDPKQAARVKAAEKRLDELFPK